MEQLSGRGYTLTNIEDYPFIIRFKTETPSLSFLTPIDIEDYPFIIRFKTSIKDIDSYVTTAFKILKIIHL